MDQRWSHHSRPTMLTLCQRSISRREILRVQSTWKLTNPVAEYNCLRRVDVAWGGKATHLLKMLKACVNGLDDGVGIGREHEAVSRVGVACVRE